MSRTGITPKIITYLFLSLSLLVSVYPFYWMVIGSTLDGSTIFHLPPHLLPGGHFIQNLQGLEAAGPVWTTLWNSLFIAIVYTVATLYLSAIAGYSFAKYEFKGKQILFLVVLVTMMLPQQVTLIPLFKMMSVFGWQNQPQSVILPSLANAFGVFFMRQNMMNVPTDMIEAARIDGCGELSIFHRIILPTTYPALSALAILSFIQQWGNFMWPLVILQNQSSTTLPVFLSMLVQPGQVIHYGQVLTGTVVGIIPILVVFLVFQKYFVSGIYGGAVKG
ncbi:carbohydrate ABC transporter permease [Fodinisporobacter ferrooxydans]|uniref:Carbohydrate ABC transporter permease n=1 Tax=Fodinisporobacter ferrooxydans TaxID=2901836 RepID=A0ABY4CFB0_9BACL|nr:carbohydrate ABC transporter permease [Alicyclobacillaceae bacterium MYW30-H2]